MYIVLFCFINAERYMRNIVKYMEKNREKQAG